MKIKNIEMNDNVVIELGKFSILWAEFERLYCFPQCNSGSIKEFVVNHNVNEKYLQNLSNALQCRKVQLNNSSIENIRYNLILEHSNPISEKDKNLIMDFIGYKGNELIKGAFLAIYRIRNNLLHGLKGDMSVLNDQLELFKAINDVLENIQ